MPTAHRLLPGGLVLRTAIPGERAQIEALLVGRGEPGDDVDHRLVVDDPDAGWAACAVVVDGDRVVSTATLLDEVVVLDGVRLPAGQVELVATAAGYEGRGLVRALMAWAHERSAARGHLLQVMIGIPYFYRLFGYEYAIDIPPARPLADPPAGRPVLRPARPDDLAALATLQDGVQAAFDVRVPHSPPRQRWLLAHDTSTTQVLERDGTVVASARVTPPDDDVLVAEAAAVDPEAARELLAGLVDLAGGAPLRIVDRRGSVPSSTWDGALGPAGDGPQQYYLRLADVPGVLTAVQPVLERRLRASGLSPGQVLLSTFGRHHRWPVAADGSWGPLSSGGPLQAPGSAGGLGVAPDALPALLFGQRGLRGLAAVRPDVYTGSGGEAYDALFPPVTADLLTYYLPW